MRDLFLVLLYLVLIIMCVLCISMDVRVCNVERQLSRVESGYQAVVAENKQLQRINEQNIQLLSTGGWE